MFSDKRETALRPGWIEGRKFFNSVLNIFLWKPYKVLHQPDGCFIGGNVELFASLMCMYLCRNFSATHHRIKFSVGIECTIVLYM
jgi:hypothetical protein